MDPDSITLTDTKIAMTEQRGSVSVGRWMSQ
jgi:hypothetical protein